VCECAWFGVSRKKTGSSVLFYQTKLVMTARNQKCLGILGELSDICICIFITTPVLTFHLQVGKSEEKEDTALISVLIDLPPSYSLQTVFCVPSNATLSTMDLDERKSPCIRTNSFDD
jgi:hypothetical protein